MIQTARPVGQSRAVPAPCASGEFGPGTPTSVDWLWHGYVARSQVTLLTSQWKTGKSTLLSLLMARMHQGGELAGRTVQRGRVLIVSEEHPTLWCIRDERLCLGDDHAFLCRPFAGKPSRAEWQGLIERGLEVRTKRSFDLLAIDTLASFLPVGVENDPDAMNELLRTLEPLTDAGLALLLMHHPRKDRSKEGQAARGTGALGAYVDVLAELRMPARARLTDRRRLLVSWSRHDVTPRELWIELSADGRDYTVCRDAPDNEQAESQPAGLATALGVLARAEAPLTRDDVLASWPENKKPNRATLWRWLASGVERGLIERTGSGHRHDPHMYAVCASNPSRPR